MTGKTNKTAKKNSGINWVPFAKKQRKIMSWWHPKSPVKEYNGIIADGSIRAGKTVPMSLSFVIWAMEMFDSQNFGICGKTIGSLRRNVISWLLPVLRQSGYTVDESRTENCLTITGFGKTNLFYLFGGRDESSQDLVQGVTLAGVLFDEVALMPESFVNQATGRCSVEGSKMWFNCNPDSPSHWFKLNWLDKAHKKGLLHIHFTMVDNPSMSKRMRSKYELLYVGVFYLRYIKGLWVVAEGAIYDMWTQENEFDGEIGPYDKSRAVRYIAIDYGTQNACVFLDIWDLGDSILVVNEYYYSGRDKGVQKTDSQYADDLIQFIGDERAVRQVIIDPSAASLIAELKTRGLRIKEADNEVVPGIRTTATLIGNRILKVHKKNCPNFIREVGSYVWDTKKTEKGNELPVKKDDHTMDAIRYFAKTVIKQFRLRQWASEKLKAA